MKIHQLEQRSAAWYAIRQGTFTASELGPFVVKTDATSAKARRKLILQKLTEEQPKDAWQVEMEEKTAKSFEYNIPVQRGNALEPLAREFYEQRTGYQVTEVGFITHDFGGFGCSPDGLVYTGLCCASHGLEIKCPMPERHKQYLLDGTLPEEYKMQVHASMAVTGLERWDFLSYCPGDAPLLLEVKRDAFTDQLEAALIALVEEKRRIKAELKRLWDAAYGEVQP